jgi:hypothetical protein
LKRLFRAGFVIILCFVLLDLYFTIYSVYHGDQMAYELIGKPSSHLQITDNADLTPVSAVAYVVVEIPIALLFAIEGSRLARVLKESKSSEEVKRTISASYLVRKRSLNNAVSGVLPVSLASAR